MVKINSYCILLVLYKVRLADAASIRSLLKCTRELTGVKLLLWDNSPEALEAQELDLLRNTFTTITYQHTPENLSLSKIYNRAYKENSHYDYLLFFDQDSNFDSNYFQTLGEATNRHPEINLFVPLIQHKGKIMSPGYYFIFRGAYRTQIDFGINSSKNMSVVASGICISLKYLNGVFEGFNENLSFYGIDTFFSIQYRKQNRHFFLLNCYFEHSLSQNEIESYQTKLKRFKNHRQALLELTRGSNLLVRIASYCYVIVQQFKFWLKYNFNRNAENR